MIQSILNAKQASATEDADLGEGEDPDERIREQEERLQMDFEKMSVYRYGRDAMAQLSLSLENIFGHYTRRYPKNSGPRQGLFTPLMAERGTCSGLWMEKIEEEEAVEKKFVVVNILKAGFAKSE